MTEEIKNAHISAEDNAHSAAADSSAVPTGTAVLSDAENPGAEFASAPTPTASEQLYSAREAIDRADAQAKARKAEERRQRHEAQREQKQLADAARARKAEDEERARIAKEKKLAELSYAENYRQKLKAERELREASTRSVMAKLKKEEEAERNREQQELRLAEAMRSEMLEAEKRNAESDELLRRIEERKRRLAEARNETVTEGARSPELPKRERAARPGDGPIIISEEGMELLAPTELPELTIPDLPKINATAEDAYGDEPVTEVITSDDETTSTDTIPTEDDEQASLINGDANAQKADVRESPLAPIEPGDNTEPENEDTADDAAKSPLQDRGETALTDATDDIADAEKEPADDRCVTAITAGVGATEEASPEKVPAENEEKSDPLLDYMSGLGTLAMLTAKTDFGIEPIESSGETETVENEASIYNPDKNDADHGYDAAHVLTKEYFEAPRRRSKKTKVVLAPAAVSTHKAEEELTAISAPTAAVSTEVERPIPTEASVTERGDSKGAFAEPIRISEASESRRTTPVEPDSADRIFISPYPVYREDEYPSREDYRFAEEGTVRDYARMERDPRTEAIDEARDISALAKRDLRKVRLAKRREMAARAEMQRLEREAVKLTRIKEKQAEQKLYKEQRRTEKRLAAIDAEIKKQQRIEKEALNAQNAKSAPTSIIVPAIIANTRKDDKATVAMAERTGEQILGRGAEDELMRRELELRAEHESLKSELMRKEAESSARLGALADAEHEARMRSIESELGAKEAVYQSELAKLSARMVDLEREHSIKEDDLKSSIASYENKIAASEAIMRAPDYVSAESALTPISSYADEADDIALANEAQIRKQDRRNASVDLEREAEKIHAAMAIADITVAEYKKQMRRSARCEEKLILKSRKITAKMKNKTGEDLILLQTDLLTVKRLLLESYANDYRLSLACGTAMQKKRYRSLVDRTVAEYNLGIDRWCEMTESVATRCPSDLHESIEVGKPLYIPTIVYTPERPEKQRLTKKDKIQIAKDAQRYDALDKAKRKRAEASVIKDKADRKSYSTDEAHSLKPLLQRDKSTTEARIDYRISRIEYSVAARGYRYAEDKARDKAAAKDAKRRIDILKRSARTLAALERSDRERYSEIVRTNTQTVKAPRRADRVRMEQIRERIISLLMQKDEVNRRLISLYRDNDSDSPGGTGRNISKKITAIKLRATKRSYAQQRAHYARIRKMRITHARKEDLYVLMDRRTALYTHLAECEYRIRHERPKGAARNALLTDIRRTRSSLKTTEREIRDFIRKAERRSRKVPTRASMAVYSILLVALVATVALLVTFWGSISGYIGGLLSSLGF